MNQININPTPAVSIRILKNTTEVSWFSETSKSAQHKEYKKLKKALKKNKKND